MRSLNRPTHALRVRELRRAARLTQPQLAQVIGVCARTVKRWEIEGRMPRPRSKGRLDAWLDQQEYRVNKEKENEWLKRR